MGSKRSQLATGQHPSPTVYPKKRGKTKSLRKKEASAISDVPEKATNSEHRIDIGDEESDLVGYYFFSGKLALVKNLKSSSIDEKTGSTTANLDSIDAKLTSKALVWGSQTLYLEDVVSVSHSAGLRQFTVHSYPLRRRSCGLSCIIKPRRSPKDFCFMASSPEEAFQWISGFADQQCFVKSAPHPMDKKHSSELLSSVPFYYDQMLVKCKSPPRVLVILNPRSGHGRSTKDFHGKVEPIFKLAGFKMEVVKTTSAGYAKKLASTVDFSTCPDGIICVGGDGIVNEVGRVRAVVSEGVKEIWLSNEDTGAYGRDIGTSLPHLLNAIVAELPPDRSTMLRIGMTNPPYIVEHLEEIAKALCHPSVYSFLHVPVQSGSDSVLQGKVQVEKNQWRVS